MCASTVDGGIQDSLGKFGFSFFIQVDGSCSSYKRVSLKDREVHLCSLTESHDPTSTKEEANGP